MFRGPDCAPCLVARIVYATNGPMVGLRASLSGSGARLPAV